MELLQKIEFKGRSGLTRTLESRFANRNGFFICMGLFSLFGLYTAMDLVPSLLHGHWKHLFTLSSLFTLLGMVLTGWLAHLFNETGHVRIHLHREMLIYERKGKEGAVEVKFSNIDRIRFARSSLVNGFFIDLKTGGSLHIPLVVERCEYILDALCFYRPETTLSASFMKTREEAIMIDHVLAHAKDFFNRGGMRLIWFCFTYPMLIKRNLARLRKDPTQVRRDVEYEKKIEKVCDKAHIALTLTSLLLLVLWKI